MKKLRIFPLLLLISAVVHSKVTIDDLAKDQTSDLLQEGLDQYHKSIRAEMDAEYKEQIDNEMEKLVGATKNMCTNGKDATKLSEKQFLTEFAIGPCNPAIFLPGIGGSKLRVEIDCKTLKEKDPSTFGACGWKRCSGLQSPKSEYRVWLPDLFAPMSITVDNENARQCFNAVMGFDTSDARKGILKPRAGLKVSIEGNKFLNFAKF
jgi:hypothetical protein